MRILLNLPFICVLPFMASCVQMGENGGIRFTAPQIMHYGSRNGVTSECIDGKQTTKIYISNPGFESDVLGAPSYWKYGIDKGWGIEADPTYLLDPQKGAGTFDIQQHKVITINVENSGDNVGFLHRGTVKIKQTLNHPLKANATYTLTALIGRRIDIPFGSYRLALFAGNELLAKTSRPVPVEGEFLKVQLIAKTPSQPQSLGRPLKIELQNTSTTSKNHHKKTQVVVDNFELYEETACSAPATSEVP